MCQYIRKYSDDNTYRGYKIVFENKIGEKFSPVTGMKYEEGEKIVPPKKMQYIFEPDVFQNVLYEFSHAYNEGMRGLTGVFEFLSDAKANKNDWEIYEHLDGFKLKIYKATVSHSDGIRKGSYGSANIYLGESIKFIKEIK